MIPNKEDTIYTAGFFDGEGYIGRGWKNRIEIKIVNNNEDVINYLHDLWGGIIYKRKRKDNPALDLVIYRKSDVLRFINTVYPFLKVKKEQIDKTLEVIKTK